jgi:glycosyltransferase involved in cell wall biosynthesis
VKAQSIPLSVIILTHRRDERFISALASAQPAEEILIVDYHSGNDWLKLKKQFHFTKVSRSEPIHNFSAERNLAMQQAKNTWVFFLDSDEVIEPASWQVIEQVMQDPQLAGAFIRRCDVFYGQPLKFGETGQVWLLRLLRKSAGQFNRPVHEIAQTSGQTIRASITLLHFAHTSIAEFLNDLSQYARIEAEYQADSQLPTFLLGIKTLVYPKLKFIVNYFFKLGFLDGWRGLVYVAMMSLHSLFVRVFSYENR